MMYYTPQIWCSDNTDAITDSDPVWNILLLSGIGSWISRVCSAEPSDRKNHPLHTRGVVAMSGTFGYELDLLKLSEEEKDRRSESQSQNTAKYAPLIQNGRYYRLTDPIKSRNLCMGDRWKFSGRSSSQCCHGGDPWKYDCELCAASRP